MFEPPSVHDRNDGALVNEVVIGIVKANADPEHGYRVQVSFPSMTGGGEGDKDQPVSAWARVASMSAGHHIGDDDSLGPRGAYFMPEIGDEVLVVFESGHVSRPIIIGRLWSDVPPEKSGGGGGQDEGKPNRPVYSHTQAKGLLAYAVDGDPDGTPKVHNKTKHEAKKNDLSGFRTRSGHLFVFNDHKDEEAIYLRSAKKLRIELVDGGDKGILIADSKDNYVWLKGGSAGGDIEIKTEGNITLDAKKNIVLKAGKDIQTTSEANTTMKSTGSFSVDAKGEMKLNTQASGTVSAQGALKLTGHPININ